MNLRNIVYLITSIFCLNSVGAVKPAQVAQNLPAQTTVDAAQKNQQKTPYYDSAMEHVGIATSLAKTYGLGLLSYVKSQGLALDRYLAPKIWVLELLYALVRDKDIRSVLVNYPGDLRYTSSTIKIGTHTIPVYVGLNMDKGDNSAGTDGILLRCLDNPFDQQAGALGHEILHFMNRHPLKAGAISLSSYILLSLFLKYGQKAWTLMHDKAKQNNWNKTVKVMDFCESISPISTVQKSFFLSLIFGYGVCNTMFKNYLRRKFETAADIGSAKLFGTAQGLINLFTRHVATNSDSGKYPLIVQWLHTHPTMQNRIDSLQPLVGYPGKYKEQLRQSLAHIHKDVSAAQMWLTGKPYICQVT